MAGNSMLTEAAGVWSGLREKVERLGDQKSLLLAAAVGIGGILLVQFYFIAREREIGGFSKVVVASRDLKAGTRLSRDMLTVGSFPERYLESKNIRPNSLPLLLGQKTIVPIRTGRPFLWDYVLTQESTNFSDKLAEGERAYTIAVDKTSGVGGFIQPNDRVDIVGTFQIPGDGEVLNEVNLVLMQSVTVLAVGEKTNSFGVNSHYGSLTLKLASVKEAQILSFAMRKGKIEFLLRNSRDVAIEDTTQQVKLNSILTDVMYARKIRGIRSLIRYDK